MDWNMLGNIAQAVEAVGIVGSLIFIGFQMRMDRKDAQSRDRAQQLQHYQNLEYRYNELLMRVDSDPALDLVWRTLAPERQAEFDQAQAGRPSGAWHVMNQEERRSYRHTRLVLELFEQAYRLHNADFMDSRSWEKWHSSIANWKSTSLFSYVYEDAIPRLTPEFLKEFEIIASLGIENAGVGFDVANVPRQERRPGPIQPEPHAPVRQADTADPSNSSE